MISRSDRACYKVVLSSGLITKEDLDHAQKQAESSNLGLADWIIQKGLMTEADLLSLFAQDLDTEVIDLKQIQADKALLAKIPVKFVWYYKFFPVQMTDGKLKIAVSKVPDVHTLDEIRFGLGFELEAVFARSKDIEDMLIRHYGLGADTVDKILTQSPQKSGAPVVSHEEREEDIEKLAETASVVQLVNQIILEAYRKNASDIHIEPYRGKVRLRYRIDGKLQEMGVPPEMNQFLFPLLSRIKIMANLNIVEKRLPQDGKARVKVQDKSINLRISSLPTPHGESLVIRLLPTDRVFSLEELGFEQDVLRLFKRLIQHPHGVLFVTGPTGSGKSTTLYAALHFLNTTDKKIVTLEDPVEYEMQDMIQMQVNPEIDLSFARGLRSVLRHDPDILMVGEVRDFETADIAIRVALTGHLILSTLHTNDAASGVTRLLDIGVEPYLIASSIVGFMAQRLVRVICPHCKEEDKQVLPEIIEMIRKDLRFANQDPVKVFKGKGCERCNSTGYCGRLAIHELLPVDQEICHLIIGKASAESIKKAAIKKGMQTLRQDGWRKVLRGITTPDEVLMSTPGDEPSQGVNKLHATAETEYIELPSKKGAVDSEETDLAKIESNRRKYVRVKVHLDVIFRAIDFDAETEKLDKEIQNWQGEGESENISAGGVAFKTEEKLFPGDILEIKIDLSDGQAPLETIGRILRVMSMKGEDKGGAKVQLAAVSFLAIHSQDRQRLENFCKDRAGHEAL